MPSLDSPTPAPTTRHAPPASRQPPWLLGLPLLAAMLLLVAAVGSLGRPAAGQEQTGAGDKNFGGKPELLGAESRDSTAESAPPNPESRTPNPAQDVAARHASATTLVASLTVFVLAVFVGFEIINKVPPTLHTPLMSGSNAISGITIVGAILVAGTGGGLATWLGAAAVVLAAINVVGGFLVTHRMLAMFRSR